MSETFDPQTGEVYAPPPADCSAVTKAVAAVMAEVGSVEKRGDNAFHKYKYATAADILHKLQPLMAKHGLVILQDEAGIETNSNGALTMVRYRFTLMHISGQVWPWQPIQTGVCKTLVSKEGGHDDKAINKCHTAARKYFLLALFHIPTGDFPDADAEDGEGKGDKDDPPKQERKGRMASPKVNGGGQHEPVEGMTERHSSIFRTMEATLKACQTPEAVDGILKEKAATMDALRAKYPTQTADLDFLAAKRKTDILGEMLSAG